MPIVFAGSIVLLYFCFASSHSFARVPLVCSLRSQSCGRCVARRPMLLIIAVDNRRHHRPPADAPLSPIVRCFNENWCKIISENCQIIRCAIYCTWCRRGWCHSSTSVHRASTSRNWSVAEFYQWCILVLLCCPLCRTSPAYGRLCHHQLRCTALEIGLVLNMHNVNSISLA